MSDPAIAILPYGSKQGSALATTPLDALIWPLGRPDRLAKGTVANMGPQDHLVMYPKTLTHFELRRAVRARISLILGEPSVIHAKHMALLRLTWRRFFRILTFNQGLLDHLPNATLFPLGTTWVPEWRNLTIEKTAMTSLIASSKRDTEGHKLRHAIADWSRETGQDVELKGGGYRPFGQKAEGLAPYRYSVVIENVRETNYFSEKLVDAILCETVPIYWGCPNLDRFMDPAGIIQCQDEGDIRAAIAAASEADYQSRLPTIRALQPQVERYCDIDRRAADAIRAAL